MSISDERRQYTHGALDPNQLDSDPLTQFRRWLDDAIEAKLVDAMTKAARSAAFTKLAKKKGFTIAPQNAAAFEAYLAKMNRDVIAIMKSAGIYQSKKK